MTYNTELELQGYDRIPAVPEWFLGGLIFKGVPTIRGV